MIPQVESILNSLRTSLGETSAMERIYRRLPVLSQSGVPLLLIGELGVGKETLVQAIAQLRSDFRHEPMRLRMLDGRLDASRLERHADTENSSTDTFFQWSDESETASPQTLYLANVESFSLETQRRFLRWWNAHPSTMVIASTTQSDSLTLLEQDLLDEILYYRIGGVRLELPPLRKRPKDIQRLANRELLKIMRLYTYDHVEWDEAAIQFLTAYDWSGNRYELKSTTLFAVQQWLESNPSIFESPDGVPIHSHRVVNANEVRTSSVDLDCDVDRISSAYENTSIQKNNDAQKDIDEKKDNIENIAEDIDSRILFSADFLPPIIRGEIPSESLSSRFRSRLSFADLVVEVIEKGLNEQSELAQNESRGESDHLYERILEPIERELIRQVYKDCRYVRIHTANRLGINRNTLYKKLSDYELESDQ